jgi:uncharacterized membrane protein
MNHDTRSEHKARPSFSVLFGRALKRYFVTGLATLLPVVVTVWLLVQIFKIADNFLGRYFGASIPGLGLLATCMIIMVVGVVSIHLFGRLLIQALEVGFSRIPVVKSIYPAIKQIASFLFGDGEGGGASAFRRVVLVQYPRPRAWALAFVTNEDTTAVTGRAETLLTLLVPNPPSPFSGPVLFVPKEDVIPLTMSVEDALKLIVSGGVVGSPLKPAEAGSTK